MRRLGSFALQATSSQFGNDEINKIVEELELKKDSSLYKTLINGELVPSFRALKIPDSLDNAYIAIDEDQAKQFYEEFLVYLQAKEYLSSVPLEKHHILPKHAGGGDEPSNLISISPEDHVAVHMCRYQAFGEKGDELAYLMRLTDSNERAQLRAKAAVLANRQRGNGFFNSDWQRIQGLKGGKVSGSMNTPEQQRARSRIGKMFGRTTGLGNQSSSLKEVLRHELHWVYNNGDKFITSPAKSAQEIITQLNELRPFSIKNSSAFYKVFHGERKKMYGWTLEKMEIVDMAISSEVGEGTGSPERSETSA